MCILKLGPPHPDIKELFGVVIKQQKTYQQINNKISHPGQSKGLSVGTLGPKWKKIRNQKPYPVSCLRKVALIFACSGGPSMGKQMTGFWGPLLETHPHLHPYLVIFWAVCCSQCDSFPWMAISHVIWTSPDDTLTNKCLEYYSLPDVSVLSPPLIS
jgi:hypothetical protein